jgi:hypothetical protein
VTTILQRMSRLLGLGGFARILVIEHLAAKGSKEIMGVSDEPRVWVVTVVLANKSVR